MTGGLQSQADERSSNSAVVSSGKRDLLGEHRSLFTGALGGTTWAVFQCSQCFPVLVHLGGGRGLFSARRAYSGGQRLDSV